MTKTKKVIKVSGPENLILVLPELLGFSPMQCLIIVGVKGPQDKVIFTKEIELPRKTSDLSISFLGQIKQLVQDSDCDGLIALFYIPENLPIYKATSEMFVKDLSNDVYFKDILWVIEDSWASYLCHDLDCCPLEGKKVKQVSVRQLQVQKLVNPKNYENIFKSIGVDPKIMSEFSRFNSQQVKASKNKKLVSWQKLQFKYLSQKSAFSKYSNKLGARLLYALTDIAIRDALLAHYIASSVNKKDPVKYLNQIAQAWTHIINVSPTELRSPICTCIGVLWWQAGETSKATQALLVARENDPTYRLTNLVVHALETGMPAQEFRDSFTKISNPWT
jgi:hypothetical protein